MSGDELLPVLLVCVRRCHTVQVLEQRPVVNVVNLFSGVANKEAEYATSSVTILSSLPKYSPIWSELTRVGHLSR